MEPDPVATPAEPPSVRQSVAQVTRFAAGALGGAIDQGAVALGLSGGTDANGEAPGRTAGDVAVGAVVTAQDALFDRAERVIDRVGPLARWAAGLPLVRPMNDAVGRRIADLGERGAAERADGRALLGSTVDNVVGQVLRSDRLGTTVDEVVAEVLPGILPSVMDMIAEDPDLLVPMVSSLLGPILDSALPEVMDKLAADPDLLVPMVNSLLGPILDSALPEVMDKLNQDPEVVRNLVLGQSTSIAGDMAGAVRSRGVSADDFVERIARRVTLRKPRAELPGPQRQLGAGESS